MNNKTEITGNEVANQVMEDLDKVSLIPDENKMVDTFFYKYAYPRLMGIEEDEEFIAKYAKQFGLNKPVQLFSESGEKSDVVPPFLNNGILDTNIDLRQQSIDYKLANARSPGLGDTKVSPVLEDVELKVSAGTSDKEWLKIHEEYLVRNKDILPQVNEDIDVTLDEAMDWS